MSSDLPNGPAVTDFIRNQIVLRPEKFGYVGQFAREMLRAEFSEDYSFYSDMFAIRLTTTIMCGSTINEKPEVVLNMPASPWQHLKHRADKWADKKWCDLHNRIPKLKVWLWFVYWAALLVVAFIKKRKIQWTEVRAAVNFEQRVMYPELDMPAQAGRPVIFETLSVNYPGAQPPFGGYITNDPSRFLNKHEIMNQFRSDPVFANQYGRPDDPMALLIWLERHGVNTDQIVKRR